MELLGYIASVLIGISLGLIGGGGSILTVPILVYLFKVDAQQATSYSLFIVGITSLVGAIRHFQMGNLKIKSAMNFALPSLASLLIVRKVILPLIPNELFSLGNLLITKNLLIMVVFAILMLMASMSMIRKKKDVVQTNETNFVRLGFIGFMVGLVTGFLGAGGGFLIIPALIFFAGLDMKRAVGTSLFIIFVNSLLGFAGDIINGVQLNYQLLGSISVIAIAGLFVGTFLSKKIDGAKLKPAFGWFVLVMGIYIIIKEVFLH